MTVVKVGLVADPAAPTDIARGLTDLRPRGGGDDWDVSVLSEPFTTGSEDVRTASERLCQHRDDQGWDVVVGLTELPLHSDDGGHLLADVDGEQGVAVLSLPALGGVRMRSRARRAVRRVVGELADGVDDRRTTPPRGAGRARVLAGMVAANRPWRLVPGLKSALVAALATGAVATVNSTVWVLADSLSWWRLVVATVLSVALVVGWLIVDAGLWERPVDSSVRARRRARLYNTSTLLTLLVGVSICYVGLYVVNLAWALFVLDPEVVGGYLRTGFGYGDIALLAWFVASAATVGGGLGSGLESDEAVRAAAYSKREEERRSRLDDDSDSHTGSDTDDRT